MKSLRNLMALQLTAYRLTTYHFAPVVRKYGLSLEEYRMLLELETLITYGSSKNPSMGDLAKYFCLPCNSLSRAISRLEKQGLIKRWQDRDDRRVVRIELSPCARIVLRAIEDEVTQDKLGQCLSTLRPDRYKQLCNSLQEWGLSLARTGVPVKGITEPLRQLGGNDG